MRCREISNIASREREFLSRFPHNYIKIRVIVAKTTYRIVDFVPRSLSLYMAKYSYRSLVANRTQKTIGSSTTRHGRQAPNGRMYSRQLHPREQSAEMDRWHIIKPRSGRVALSTLSFSPHPPPLLITVLRVSSTVLLPRKPLFRAARHPTSDLDT